MYYLYFKKGEVYFTECNDYYGGYYLRVNNNISMKDDIVIGNGNVEYVQTETTAELRFMYNNEKNIYKLRGVVLNHKRVMLLLIDLFVYRVRGLRGNGNARLMLGEYLHEEITNVIDFMKQLDENSVKSAGNYLLATKYMKFINEIPEYDIKDVIVGDIENTGSCYIEYKCGIAEHRTKLIVDEDQLYDEENARVDLEIMIVMGTGNYYIEPYEYKFEHSVYTSGTCIADICKDKFKYEKEIRVIVDLMLKYRSCLFRYIDETYRDYSDELPTPMMKSARSI